MGINQFLTVANCPRQSPVKTMFPIIAGNDLYQDTVTQGGLLDGPYWAVRSALGALADVVADHIPAFLVGGATICSNAASS